MSPCTSVAVVTFNGDRFVAEQLASIASQSPAPYEVVIADDGSTDRTLEVAASVLSSASFPVHIIGGDHVGLRQNVERALRACNGSVIVLADQDDIWLPGRLAAIERAFEDPSVTMWMSDAELVDESGEDLGARLWANINLSPDARREIAAGSGARRLLHGMTVTGATMAFRASLRSLVLPLPAQLDGPDHLYLHDGWIAVLAALVGEVVVDERAFTLYRQHPQQFTEMRVTQSTNTSSALRTPARRHTIADEHTRISLVRTRLAEKGELGSLRPADQALLSELEDLLRHRKERPGVGRTRAILSALRNGRYDSYARGWRTALADLLYPRR